MITTSNLHLLTPCHWSIFSLHALSFFSLEKNERFSEIFSPSTSSLSRLRHLPDINNDVVVDEVEPAASADKPEPEEADALPTGDGEEDLPHPEESPAPCEEKEAEIWVQSSSSALDAPDAMNVFCRFLKKPFKLFLSMSSAEILFCFFAKF